MKQLFCLIILCPLLFFSQSQKKYSGLLWKISGNGLKKPSYLYGTMHVSNRVAYYLSEQFFDALKSVDVVGLETNPGEWLENMEQTGELDQLSQFKSSEYYGRDFYKSTFAVSFPEKRMLQGILSYDPDIIDGLLYRQNRAKENFEENTYIDLFIFQSASKLNKQVISLENFTQSEIQARLSALPDEETEQENGYKDSYSSFQKIEDAYRDGNLDMLDSLSKLNSSKNTQRYLIDNRNVFFAQTIDSVLKTKSLFSGVGAAHLPGENGLIELLRKKGYTLEAVQSKVSKKSNATREQLDAQVKGVNFQKVFVKDSVFSVSLPGKLSQIINLENVKYYIYADMVNGSFYTIVRLNYFGPLFNVSAQQMMQKVDSLLFEYIPGKIISKKEILSNTGLKGIELINKTRRGDEQHYQLFFTDLEMILFKLGGKNQYATGAEAKQFFNSIQFRNKTENAVTFAPKTKGFEIKVPANYNYAKNDGASVIGLVEDVYAYSKTKNQFCGLKHAVYNDFNYLEEDTFELNQLSKNCLNNYNFKEAISSEYKADQGLPCIRFKAKNTMGSNFYGKLFIKGVHYYLVYFISEKESSLDNEFFTSFKLTNFNYINPIKEITDSDFNFKAKDEVSDNALSRFNELYAKAYKDATKKTKKTTAINDFDFKSNTKYYYSPSSNEYVNIIYEKYNDYDYKNVNDLDKKLSEGLRKLSGLIVTHKTTNYKDGVYTYNCQLKDTATARAIVLKVFFKNGTMYEITSPCDTAIGLQGWAKDFMESFTPKDTVIGKNIFENKFAKLLDDLCSSDTLKKKQANTSLQNSLGFQKDYINDFVAFISGNKLNLVQDESKAQLFVNGGILESDKIIEPYKKLYKNYTDSFYLQLCLLKGLAYLKTQASYDVFYNLITNETPLVGSDNIVSDVFAVLHDSLELSKKFFPGILALTKYDEYRESIYRLMADLVNKKIISSQTYTLQKDGILADANLALKRINSSGNKTAQVTNDSGTNDRYAKELAEVIKVNLDGLTNNTLYKGSGYLRNMVAYSRPALVNYAYILSPFYKTDEKTKQFFGKVNKLKPQTIAMPVAINLLKQNIVINDTLVAYYCKNKITRAYFYSELEKEKLTDKFNKNYLNQRSLVESVLSSQKQLNSFYNYEKDRDKKDSLVLLNELVAKNKFQRGKMYVYKSVRNKNEDEQWSVAFVNDSKELITSKIEVISSNFNIDKTKTQQENLNELLNYFYLTYRKRAALNNEADTN
jgi:uncharacterized protein YbaP (TraB family)